MGIFLLFYFIIFFLIKNIYIFFKIIIIFIIETFLHIFFIKNICARYDTFLTLLKKSFLLFFFTIFFLYISDIIYRYIRNSCFTSIFERVFILFRFFSILHAEWSGTSSYIIKHGPFSYLLAEIFAEKQWKNKTVVFSIVCFFLEQSTFYKIIVVFNC